MTAALALTGAVPSFAAADNNSKDGRMVSSAEIDWEDAPDVEGTSVIMIAVSYTHLAEVFAGGPLTLLHRFIVEPYIV